MYYFEGSVYVEDEDQCQTCTNFAKGIACPLLQALGMGVVVMQDNMYVTNCGFYVEFKRHLRIIKDTNGPEGSDQTPKTNKRHMKQ